MAKIKREELTGEFLVAFDKIQKLKKSENKEQREIGLKSEKALEKLLASKKGEAVKKEAPKKSTPTPKAKPKAESKAKPKSKAKATTKAKTKAKSTAKKSSSTSKTVPFTKRASILMKKEGITWEQAKSKLKAQINEEKKKLKNDKKQALDDLQKLINAPEFQKAMGKYGKSVSGGKKTLDSDIERDAKRPAKPRGKRTSKSGKTYYEYRDNRSDVRQSGYPYLAEGGAIDSLKKQMDDKLEIHSEYYKKGGRTIKIVNDGVKYDKSKYKAVYGDFDKDGTVNIDDANPLDRTKSGKVEQVELRKTFDKLLSVKAELDDIMYDAVETLDDKAPKGADIYARTKTPYSILKKLVEKRMLDPKRGLTDMIGTTIAVENQKELEQVRDEIDDGLLGKVLDRDDFYKSPNAGYRAYHYIVEYKGVPVEVQLKTKNMKKLHEVSHDAYKTGNLDAKSLDSVSKTFMKADKGDKKAKAEIKKLLSNKKSLMSKISKKMEAGGTLPTPFGQAGLVGETGAMNEVDLFAMGGGLPQGVHQYYANTYNPAYPTPHGYAKGGLTARGKSGRYHILGKSPSAKQPFFYASTDDRASIKSLVSDAKKVFKDLGAKNVEVFVTDQKEDRRIFENQYAKGGEIDEYIVIHTSMKPESFIKKHNLSNYEYEIDETDYDGFHRINFETYPKNQDFLKDKSIMEFYYEPYEEYAKGGMVSDKRQRVAELLVQMEYDNAFYDDELDREYGTTTVDEAIEWELQNRVKTDKDADYYIEQYDFERYDYAKGGEITKTGNKGSARWEMKITDDEGNTSSIYAEKKSDLLQYKKMYLAKGGKIGFDGLAKKVAKRYVGKAVPKRFQEEYGKTYSKSEAMEVGKKVAGKVYREQQSMAKGGRMKQGYNDRLDESLGMRNIKGINTKQSYKDRRDESKGMEKAMGRRAYQSVGTMDKMADGGKVKRSFSGGVSEDNYGFFRGYRPESTQYLLLGDDLGMLVTKYYNNDISDAYDVYDEDYNFRGSADSLKQGEDKFQKIRLSKEDFKDKKSFEDLLIRKRIQFADAMTMAKGGLTKTQQNQNLKAEKIRKSISLKAQEKYGLSNSEREAYENVLFWAYDKQSHLKEVTNINIDDKDYSNYQKLQDKGLIVIGDDVTDDLVKVGLPSNFNKKLFSKGGEVIEYSKVYDILESKIEDAVADLYSTYENSERAEGEEVEHKSRDGFIPFTNGGYSSRWFEYSNVLEGSGISLPTKSLEDKVEEFRENNREYALERFEEEYPEIVEELGGIDNVDYNSLMDAGYDSEADDLDEFERDDEDSIMMEVEAFYYNPNNDRGEDGKHTIQLSGVVNLEAPYHRSGNLEDYIEERFTFDSYKELEDKLDKGLAKVVSWFEGDMYDKNPRELKIRRMKKGGKTKRSKHSLMQDRRRVSKESWEVAYQKRKKNKMEAGGTLPTPFGQAGLVGETGTMNEMELFAMGGGLPQGVHQYYANTYNPAYPIPHGYAKGGEVEGGAFDLSMKEKAEMYKYLDKGDFTEEKFMKKFGKNEPQTADIIYHWAESRGLNTPQYKRLHKVRMQQMGYAKGGMVEYAILEDYDGNDIEKMKFPKPIIESEVVEPMGYSLADIEEDEDGVLYARFQQDDEFAKGGATSSDTSDVYFFAYEEFMKNGKKFKSEKDLYDFVNDGYSFPKYSKKSVNSALKTLNKEVYAKGGKTQGYNDKLDESLGNTKGKRSTKEQNYKDRRNESEAMEKKGGKRKYARVKTMDKGNRKKKMKTPMTLAKVIRREGEKWQDAVKRASAMIRKDS